MIKCVIKINVFKCVKLKCVLNSNNCLKSMKQLTLFDSTVSLYYWIICCVLYSNNAVLYYRFFNAQVKLKHCTTLLSKSNIFPVCLNEFTVALTWYYVTIYCIIHRFK